MQEHGQVVTVLRNAKPRAKLKSNTMHIQRSVADVAHELMRASVVAFAKLMQGVALVGRDCYPPESEAHV